MCIFPVLFLLILTNILSASPVPPKDFFSALAVSCHTIDVTKIQAFINQGVFENCKNWTEIDQTKNLTEHTENNVRCLLYFDSFISFCEEVKTVKITTIEQQYLVPDLKDYTVENICKNWTVAAHKKFEHNTSKSIINEYVCKKLCITYENTVPPECSLAHHFANFNVTTLLKQNVSKPMLGEASHDSNRALPKAAQALKSAALANEAPKQNEPSKQGESPGGAPQTEDEKIKKTASVLHSGNTVDAQGQKPSIVETAEDKLKLKAGKVPAPPVPEAVGAVAKDAAAVENPPAGKEEAKGAEPSKLEGAGAPVDPAIDLQNSQDTKQNEKSQLELSPGVHKDEPVADNAAAVDEGDAKTDLEKEEGHVDNKEYDDEHDEKADHGEDPEENENPEIGKPEVKEVNEKKEQTDEQKEKQKTKQETKQNDDKANVVGDSPISQSTSEDMEGESYFFSYFMVICVLFVLGYVGYHNRQKVMALVLEGKRGKRQYRGRRPNSANYHKLDSNLEEAISSTCTKNSSHVIY